MSKSSLAVYCVFLFDFYNWTEISTDNHLSVHVPLACPGAVVGLLLFIVKKAGGLEHSEVRSHGSNTHSSSSPAICVLPCAPILSCFRCWASFCQASSF